jgi:hypothetical protein
MKLIGYITTCILISIFLFFLEYIFGNNFIHNFIDNNVIDFAATLLGFNIAIQTILLGQLVNIETTLKKLNIFSKTRRELKDNSIMNFIILFFIFLMKILHINSNSIIAKFLSQQMLINFNTVLDILIVGSIVMVFFLIVETIKAVYSSYNITKRD